MELPLITRDDTIWTDVMDKHLTKENVFGCDGHVSPEFFLYHVVKGFEEICERSCSQKEYLNSWFHIIECLHIVVQLVVERYANTTLAICEDGLKGEVTKKIKE